MKNSIKILDPWFQASSKDIKIIQKNCEWITLISVQQNNFSQQSKYTDKHKLSDQQISSILQKQPSRPTIIQNEQIQDQRRFNMDIQQQLQLIKTYVKSQSQMQEAILDTFKRNAANTSLTQTNKENNIQNNKSSTLENANNQNSQITPSETFKGVQIKYLQYNLPIPNIPDQIESYKDPLQLPQVETPNMRLWEVLRLNQNSSYSQYELELKNKFNNELDMYGNQEDEALIRQNQQAVLKENAVPQYLIDDKQYMERLNNQVTLNFNMPGTMEAEHPHQFMKNLRPIEEFRNTPIIPISDKQMRQHQARVEAYHRRGFFFEIKKETILNYMFAAIVGGICFKMIMMALERNEQSDLVVQRLRLKRFQNTLNFDGEKDTR